MGLSFDLSPKKPEISTFVAASTLMACRTVFNEGSSQSGTSKTPGIGLRPADPVLKGVGRSYVAGIGRVHERPEDDEDVAGADHLPRQRELAPVVLGRQDGVVLTHKHHRLVAVRGIGLRDRDRAGQIEDADRVEGVTVHSDDILLVERHRLTQMHDPGEGALRNVPGHRHVGFGSHEVVDRDDSRRALLALHAESPFIDQAQPGRVLCPSRNVHADSVTKRRRCSAP